jgi:hypothetical protein
MSKSDPTESTANGLMIVAGNAPASPAVPAVHVSSNTAIEGLPCFTMLLFSIPVIIFLTP